MPNPISVIQGLVIKGNVLINRHLDPKYPMSLGISPCLGTGLPCDQPTVSPAVLNVVHPEAATAWTAFTLDFCSISAQQPSPGAPERANQLHYSAACRSTCPVLCILLCSTGYLHQQIQ